MNSAFCSLVVLSLALVTWSLGCAKSKSSPKDEEPQPPEAESPPPEVAPQPVIDPQNGQVYAPGPVSYDPSLAEMPVSLPPPAIHTDLDPLTFTRTYQHVSGRAAPQGPRALNRIFAPASAAGYGLPACDFAIPAPDIKRTEPLAVDGSLADWGNRGLVAIDRAGDGAEGRAERDIRALYVGESPTHWYVFVKTAAAPANVGGETGPFVLDLTTSAYPETRTAIVSKRIRQIIYNQNGWSDYRPSEGFAPLKPESVQAALGADGIEIALAKSDPIMAELGNFIFYAVFGDGPVRIAGDRTASPIMGFAWDYACLVPTAQRTKMMVMQRLPSIPADAAEIMYRAAALAVPTVEHVLGAEQRITDTIPVALVHQPPAGTWGGPTGMFFDHSNVVGPMTDYVTRFGVAAHEFGHGYGGGDWEMKFSWVGEGHCEVLKAGAIGDFYGPVVRSLRKHDVVDTFLAAETERSAPMALDQWATFSDKYGPHAYGKAQTFLEHMQALLSPDDFVKAVSGPHETSQALLDAMTGASSFTGTIDASSWNGWIFGTSYDGALFPAPTESPSTASQGDGMADHMKIALGLDPAKPLAEADRRITVDHSVSDWELLAPDAFHTPDPGRAERITSALCVAGTHIERFGAMYDGDTVSFGLRLDGTPPPGRVITVIAHVQIPGEPHTFDIRNWYGNRNTLGYKLGAPAGTPGIQSAVLLTAATSNEIEWYQRRVWLGWPQNLPEGTKVKRLFVYASDPTAQTEGECDAVYDQAFALDVP